jgi:Peptidase S46
VNQRGELVGVTFDGSLESLPVTYLYSDEQARAVHVDVRGIVEALDRVYKSAGLLKELGATPGASRQSEPRPGYPLGRERSLTVAALSHVLLR